MPYFRVRSTEQRCSIQPSSVSLFYRYFRISSFKDQFTLLYFTRSNYWFFPYQHLFPKTSHEHKLSTVRHFRPVKQLHESSNEKTLTAVTWSVYEKRTLLVTEHHQPHTELTVKLININILIYQYSMDIVTVRFICSLFIVVCTNTAEL